MLYEIQQAGGKFTTDRHPLKHSHKNQNHGCGRSERVISWQNPDTECRECHAQNGEGHGSTAAFAVSNMTKYDGTKRSHQKAGCKCSKCGNQACDGICGWEKDMANLMGKEAVDGKVIPLQNIAHSACDDQSLVMSFKFCREFFFVDFRFGTRASHWIFFHFDSAIHDGNT